MKNVTYQLHLPDAATIKNELYEKYKKYFSPQVETKRNEDGSILIKVPYFEEVRSAHKAIGQFVQKQDDSEFFSFF